MNVTILNPEESKKLFYWWGQTSKICYDTHMDDPTSIGKHCMMSGHFSGSRSQYILFQIDNCPRFTIDQAVRHEDGVMKNVQSFRYVDKHSFTYEIPEEIKDEPYLLQRYIKHMIETINLYSDVQTYVLDKTGSKDRANESSRYLLPMSTHASFVFGLTIEALIHFCNTRLCVRAEDKIRELATLMRDSVLEILPNLKNRLVPNCQALLWCPEGGKSCGAYPTKKKLQEMIEAKNNVST